MIVIYHNPRCSKSRACNLFLETKGHPYKIINYIQNPFSVSSLKEIIQLLKLKPIELVRKNEKDWKENFKDLQMKDSEIIQAMVNYPKLIQRPIIVNGDKAVIGRPIERIETIL